MFLQSERRSILLEVELVIYKQMINDSHINIDMYYVITYVL